MQDLVFFFFSSRRRHTRCLSDWSSDVCSSDLIDIHAQCHSRPAHRERHDPYPIRDVCHGSAQHGDGDPRRAARQPPESRGQKITLAATGYRLMALDLDGTILDLKLNLDPRDVEALRGIISAGVTVVACTGRPFPGALPWVKRL